MSSDKLWTVCTACGKTISLKNATCPGCGENQKNRRSLKWLGYVALGLVGLALLGALSDRKQAATGNSVELSKSTTSNVNSAAMLPEDERVFVEAIAVHRELFMGAQNELQQSVAREQRRQIIQGKLKHTKILGWVGTISELSTNSDGKAILSVEIAPKLYLRTWNNAVSDFASDTLIEKSSPLYVRLLSAKLGDEVRVSGVFFTSEQDGFQETSMTIRGSMTEPEFLFKFSEVK